jgi:hypothetical protein
MARPSKYAAMSVEALIDVRDRVTQELTHRSKQLQAQLAHIGTYSGGVRESARNTRRSSMKGKSVPVTHRGPNGETWRNRGLPPKWLQALIKQGHLADEYRVGAKTAAAVKKTAKKTSRGRKAKSKAKAK